MKIILSILLLATPLLFSFINQAFSSINDIVYPADSKIEGLTYKQWAQNFGSGGFHCQMLGMLLPLQVRPMLCTILVF